MGAFSASSFLPLLLACACACACEHSDPNTASAPVHSPDQENHLGSGAASLNPPGQGPSLDNRMGSASTQAPNLDGAVVNELATARCDREQSCNNVGHGQKYASRDVCMDQMRGSLANDLNAANCPSGIDQPAVDKCMAAIRAEDCGHPLDTLARLEKCRTSALCMK